MADVVFILIVIVFFGMAVALVAGCNKMLGDDAEYELDNVPAAANSVASTVANSVASAGAKR